MTCIKLYEKVQNAVEWEQQKEAGAPGTSEAPFAVIQNGWGSRGQISRLLARSSA